MAHLSCYYPPAAAVRPAGEGGILLITPVVLINLFFVPALPLYLYCKSCRKSLTPSLELLFQYCITVSLNHVAAHVISHLLLKLTGAGFPLDSARYTLAAIFSGVALFFAYAVIKALKPELDITRIGGRGEEKHEQNETPEL